MDRAGCRPEVTLRIPGAWSHPGELLERLPEGVRLRPDRLFLPDGSEFEFTPVPADDQFADVFDSACRRPAQDDERDLIARYQVNVILTGPGGSMPAALAMMQAGAAIVRAGGAGVFIDNSALAHGGQDWLAMADDGSSDAVSFAFVSIVRGRTDIYTTGMHVMGYPELLMRTADMDPDERSIVELIRYICAGDRAVDVGHVLADEAGPRFHVVSKEHDSVRPGSAMHNPFGRLKIVSVNEIAEGN